MATYKPQVKKSDGTLEDLNLDAATLNGVAADQYALKTDLTDTDEKVKQSSTTTESWRKVILGKQATSSNGSAVVDQTDQVYVTPNLEFQPSTGALSLKKILITNTNMANHIEFKRNSWNYIVASGGTSAAFGFVAGGKSASGANTTLAIYGDKFIPGQRDNQVDMGDSSYHFKNFYIKGKFYNGNYNYTLPSKTGTFALTNDIPTVPTKTSELTNDSGFVTTSNIPTKLSQLTNDSNFITNTVNNLTNYYTKTNSYTKTEINNLINNISTFNALIVTTLPSSNISTTTIYLVSKSDTETDDYYDEYMYINGNWEMIGNTKIDLSNYYTKSQTFSKTEVQNLIDGLGNNLNLKADKTEIASNNERVYLVIGNTSGTAGTWTGTNEKITEYFDGLVINYKVGIAGASTTTLNINGLGAKTVYRLGTSKVTTHYEVGTMVLLSYNASKGAFYSADYDANSYAYVRQYTTNTNAEYPMLLAYETTLPSSYDTKYVRKNSTIKANPNTGTITATTFNGNATSSTKATQDGNGNVITETYATKEELENSSGGTIDDSNYAKLNGNNNFTGNNTFVGQLTFQDLLIPSGCGMQVEGVFADKTGSPGSAGQVLTSTGTGSVEWKTPSSGGGSIDTSKLAKLDENNIFEGNNTFTGENDITTLNSISASIVELTIGNAGGIEVKGRIADSTGSVGSAGQVLTSTGTGVQWTTPSASGGGSASLPIITYNGPIQSLEDYWIDITADVYSQCISQGGFIIKDIYGVELYFQLGAKNGTAYSCVSVLRTAGLETYRFGYVYDTLAIEFYAVRSNDFDNHAKLDSSNTFSGSTNTFNGDAVTLGTNTRLVANGSEGTSGQVLTSTGSGVEWRTPSSSGGTSSGGTSSGGTAYPIIDLNESGLGLDDEPSGTTTQEKINQIIQAGGFYYGNKLFAPLIVNHYDSNEISLVSRTDYVEDGYSDLYQMFIDIATKEYYTVFNVEVTFSQYHSENVAKRDNENTFTGDNWFEGEVSFNNLIYVNSIGDANGNFGQNGQVLTANSNGNVEWRTPSSSGGGSSSNCLSSGQIIVAANVNGGYTNIHTGTSHPIKFLEMFFSNADNEVNPIFVRVLNEDDTTMWEYECGNSCYHMKIINNTLLFYEDGAFMEYCTVEDNIMVVEFQYTNSGSTTTITVDYVMNT